MIVAVTCCWTGELEYQLCWWQRLGGQDLGDMDQLGPHSRNVSKPRSHMREKKMVASRAYELLLAHNFRKEEVEQRIEGLADFALSNSKA